MSEIPGRRAIKRLGICLLSTLILLAVLGSFECKESKVVGGPEMESPEDTLTWVDTSEAEIRIVEIREDSVMIVELRNPEDTNRVYTEKRYTAEELDAWERDVVARTVQVRINLIDALEALTAEERRKE